MVIQIEKRYYTPAEYLTLEEQAVDRHEYRDGEIILMPWGTTNHNQIALNFCRKFTYFKQQDGQWLFNDYQGEEGVLRLASADFEISFQDLYERVEFEVDET